MADAGNLVGHRGITGTAGIRALGEEFRNASDAKLLKVTRLIDSLPERGQADALLDPVRDRLAALRPTRRMNRSRLLFTPFDRVLVPASKWRPGVLALPRSLLAPLLALIDLAGSDMLPAEAPFDAGDPLELNRCGHPLWSAAADVLARSEIPPGWAEPSWQMRSGLSMTMLEQMLPVAEMVFRRGLALRTLPPHQDPAFEPAVTALLLDAAERGPLAWGIMLVLLFDHAPPDLIVRLGLSVARGGRMSTMLQSGLDQAITELLIRVERSQHQKRGDEADGPALLVDRLVVMHQLAALRRMENRPADEQRRVARLRHALAEANRTLLDRVLSSHLQRFEGALADADGLAGSAETILSLEADSRRMRVFVLAASRLEDGQEYDRLIEAATLRLAERTLNAAHAQVARLRLIELLAGSERALQLLPPM